MAERDELDPLFEQARDLVRAEGQASISLLQRRFGINYNRGFVIMCQLEAEGIVTPPNLAACYQRTVIQPPTAEDRHRDTGHGAASRDNAGAVIGCCCKMCQARREAYGLGIAAAEERERSDRECFLVSSECAASAGEIRGTRVSQILACPGCAIGIAHVQPPHSARWGAITDTSATWKCALCGGVFGFERMLRWQTERRA